MIGQMSAINSSTILVSNKGKCKEKKREGITNVDNAIVSLYKFFFQRINTH